MPIVEVLVSVLLVAVIVYVVQQVIPMDQRVRNVISVVVGVLLVIWLLRVFGLLSGHVVV